MKLNEVDFSDDFYKGKAVDVNVNGKRFGMIKFIPDKLLLGFTGKDGERVTAEYDDINTLVDELENMELN